MHRQRKRAVECSTLIVTIAMSCIGMPACTGPRVAPLQTASTEVVAAAEHAETAGMTPLIFDDSDPGVRSEAMDCERCTEALYWADEPTSSQMALVSAADLEEACNQVQIICMNRCMNNPKPPYPAQKKGDRAHFAHCH